MTPQAERYAVVGPVDKGNQFWTVTDVKKNLTLASIFTSVPMAQQIAESIVIVLKERDATNLNAIAGLN